jgi:hypothetical protein
MAEGGERLLDDLLAIGNLRQVATAPSGYRIRYPQFAMDAIA